MARKPTQALVPTITAMGTTWSHLGFLRLLCSCAHAEAACRTLKPRDSKAPSMLGELSAMFQAVLRTYMYLGVCYFIHICGIEERAQKHAWDLIGLAWCTIYLDTRGLSGLRHTSSSSLMAFLTASHAARTSSAKDILT